MTRAPTRLLQVAVVALAVLLGLVGLRVGYATFQSRDALVGILTGWLLVAMGVLAWHRLPVSRVGPLVAVAGLCWLPSDWRVPAGSAAQAAAALALLPAAVLVHAVLTHPGGRAADGRTLVAIAFGYVACLLPHVAGAVVVAGILGLRALTIGRRRPAPTPAAVRVSIAGVAYGGVLLVTAVMPWVAVGTRAIDLRVLLQAATIGLAVALCLPLLRARDGTAVTDLVVDLGTAEAADLEIELGLALHDPTLRIGYPVPGTDRFIDASGRPIDPRAGPGRVATVLEREGRPSAVLLHRAGLSTGPVLEAAVGRAAGLAAANALLQATLQAQAAELEASRRRLAVAADEERAALGVRLREGPGDRLGQVGRDLTGLRPSAPAVVDALARARRQADEAVLEIDELAEGIHPSVLVRLGLPGAIEELARRMPVPVTVRVDPGVRLDTAGESAAYFVVLETLANVVKHAAATRAWIELDALPGTCRLVIADDGVGGATAGRGYGLRGLADRVEALGGTFTLDSPSGAGTRLAATIPSGGEALQGRAVETGTTPDAQPTGIQSRPNQLESSA